mmetsp:Transcript_1350/g.2739  ORF Transcript_1350/g.2739 Transcript_1350/m.2739 type:complete len:152 (+) Transcript_1350:49-504(+)
MTISSSYQTKLSRNPRKIARARFVISLLYHVLCARSMTFPITALRSRSHPSICNQQHNHKTCVFNSSHNFYSRKVTGNKCLKYSRSKLGVDNVTSLRLSLDDDATEDDKGTFLSGIFGRNISENWRDKLKEKELGPLLPLATFIDEVTGGW